jgi:hypothetical protein
MSGAPTGGGGAGRDALAAAIGSAVLERLDAEGWPVASLVGCLDDSGHAVEVADFRPSFVTTPSSYLLRGAALRAAALAVELISPEREGGGGGGQPDTRADSCPEDGRMTQRHTHARRGASPVQVIEGIDDGS